MSFNVRCVDDVDKRARNLCGCIKLYRPDVLGVQEATPKWMGLLKEYLSEYDCVGEGRDGGSAGEHSAIFFLRDKYTLVQSETFWLSATPDEISVGWDASLRRVCTWARFKTTEGLEFLHYNTHLDHIGEQARQNGAALVAERIMSAGVPAVLTGDFNHGEATQTYRNVISCGMADAKYMARFTMSGGTWHDFGRRETVDMSPIDYIFVTPEYCTVDSYMIIDQRAPDGSFLSDHYGLIADITVI